MTDRLAQLASTVNGALANLQRAGRRISGLDARLSQLGSRAIRSTAAVLPALPAGAATDVAVAWSPSMPDTSYQVFPSVAGGPVLIAGKLQLTIRLNSRTVDGCTVVVTNTNASAIADSSGVLWVLAVNPST